MKADYECTLTLAIDGPAASGKSVVGREVARRLGIRFLDTGAMYRAITLASIQQGVAADDACKLSSLAAGADMRLVANSNGDRLLLNGDDITPVSGSQKSMQAYQPSPPLAACARRS